MVAVGPGVFLVAPTRAATTFRIATLTPRNTTWGKVYSTWAKAIEAKTGGALAVQILWNGTAGMSSGIVQKITAGQLEGGALSLADLSANYPDVFALELPGAMKAWSEFDPVRAAFEPDLAAALDGVGLRLGWWEDWGRVHLFTRGYAAPRPFQLAGKQITSGSSSAVGDPVVAEILSMVNGSVSAPSASSQPSLTLPDGFFGPAMFAGPQFPVDHVGEDVLWCGTAGAMVFGKKILSALPPDVVQTIEKVNAAASRTLATKVRNQDDAAYAQLARTMTVVTHTPAEAAEWNRLFARVATELAKGKLDRIAVNRVLAMRGLPKVP